MGLVGLGRGGTPEGCTVFSPAVEEGRKPRRRPRDSSAGRNPLDPARGRTIKLIRRVRHPIGVVYISGDPLTRGLRHFVPRHPG